MRHRIGLRKLNRTSEHRKALRRNLSQSLIEHGQVRTTVPKAKDLRPFFEKLVTLAIRVRRCTAQDDAPGSLRARRRIHRLLSDRGMIPAEHRQDYSMMSDAQRARTMRMSSGRRYRTGQPKGRLDFTAESVIHHLIEKIAPRYEDRPGGYTRIIHLPDHRVGDNSPLAIIQLVGNEEGPAALTKPATSARRRRADARYSMAIKSTKARAKKGGREEKAEEPESEQPPTSEPENVVPDGDEAVAESDE